MYPTSWTMNKNFAIKDGETNFFELVILFPIFFRFSPKKSIRLQLMLICNICHFFCYLLLSFAIFCYILLSFAIFCYLLLSFAIFCYLLLSFAIFCYLLLSFAIFCYLLLSFAIFCYLLLSFAIFTHYYIRIIVTNKI